MWLISEEENMFFNVSRTHNYIELIVLLKCISTNIEYFLFQTFYFKKMLFWSKPIPHVDMSMVVLFMNIDFV